MTLAAPALPLDLPAGVFLSAPPCAEPAPSGAASSAAGRTASAARDATPLTICAAWAKPSPALCTPPITVSAVLSLKALATSPMLKFMPLSVASVIFCTSSAWMVAASAREFCSSQNCTALSSSTRLSSSSTLMVGATQLESWGNCGMPPAAPLAKPCRKSKPGTNLPKPKGVESLMVASAEGGKRGCGQLTPMRRRCGACQRRFGCQALSVCAWASPWEPPGHRAPSSQRAPAAPCDAPHPWRP